MFIPVTDLQCVLFLVCVWHTVIIFKTANITNFVKKNCLFTYFCINEIAVIMLHYHLNVAYPLQEIRCYGLKMCWESRTFTTKLSPQKYMTELIFKCILAESIVLCHVSPQKEWTIRGKNNIPSNPLNEQLIDRT